MYTIIHHESSAVSCKENHRTLIGNGPHIQMWGPFHLQSVYPKKAPKEPITSVQRTTR